MTAAALPTPPPFNAGSTAAAEWAELANAAPLLAKTMRRYLAQAATFLAPSSVEVADNTLRQLAHWLLEATNARSVADITRDDIEDFKVRLATQPTRTGRRMAINTQRQRFGMLRVFFERIIEWEWEDAPRRNPVIGGDVPLRYEPLPKFLDDADAAQVMVAARAASDPLDRLVVETLARTGLRAGELCDLDADAIVLIGQGRWLRVPLGKLRNDRYVPLHPQLVELFATWAGNNLEHQRRHHRLIADHRGTIDRHQVGRIVRRVGRAAGVTVHPHQLRHTLATQAINRGMRLEAIAALLGHRSMAMTLTYARIADRVVADEYQAVSAQVDALYGQPLELPANYETTGMAKLRRDATARMLGNGICTRPVELDCRMESACETCTYFKTGPEFAPILTRQRDHAHDHGQTDRVALFDLLLSRPELSP